VIDVLRATSVVAAGFRAGAARIVPARTVEEASELAARLGPGTLLCGERGRVRVEGFDFGNSPQDLTPDRVGGRTLVHTTTNGTRAIAACSKAWGVAAVSFSNLSLACRIVEAAAEGGREVKIVCAGTLEDFSLEDALCAGAICERVAPWHPVAAIWRGADRPMARALSGTVNGRVLLDLGLGADIDWCSSIDSCAAVGWLRRGEDAVAGLEPLVEPDFRN